MGPNVEDSPLMQFLAKNDFQYFAKAVELRKEIAGWLAYIPQTFPHYTRHTVEHSEEIIFQLSKILFKDETTDEPTVNLSSVEAYVLIAAAYLHDAGMVASDDEKAKILATQDWKDWVTEGGGAKRYAEIHHLERGGAIQSDPAIRSFLANVQLRFLIAEFIRQRHHLRVGELITQHQATLGRFAFDDPLLARTIEDVCVAHGLHRRELEDRERFPDQRDIRHEKVNVRFLALLFRLGDLLDITHERSCPLLLNAASPIPGDSIPHWNQYKHIDHRLTTPDRIEITAKCESQDEHRVLLDWCKWIEEESEYATVLMSHAARHAGWTAPLAKIGEAGTIRIRPSEKASYVFSKWQLQLDQEQVFQLLMRDVYSSPLAFIQELVQNGLDATRCRLYEECQAAGRTVSDSPTGIPAVDREKYPLLIGISEREIRNDLSGENELRQILVVEDLGIGMDHEIIVKYFLQVGCSYYSSPEFRKTYRFHPTSQFGIGFLSVFAVSDHITVDTYKPISRRKDPAIRLTLQGPRNYLLTDVCDRTASGTRIEILIRNNCEIKKGQLTEFIKRICVRVEFPLLVSDFGVETQVVSENDDKFVSATPDLISQDDAKFMVRSFPVRSQNVEGEIYLFAYADSKGERWDRYRWASRVYVANHPSAQIPEVPETLECLHGIRMGHGGRWSSDESFSYRIDYRGPNPEVTLSRSERRSFVGQLQIPQDVYRELVKILREHILSAPKARDPDRWKYKQSLVRVFPCPDYWYREPDTIRLIKNGAFILVSLEDICREQSFLTIVSSKWYQHSSGLSSTSDSIVSDPSSVTFDNDKTALLDGDIEFLSDSHKKEIFQDMYPTHTRPLASGHIAVNWEIRRPNDPILELDDANVFFLSPVSLTNSGGGLLIGFSPHTTTSVVYRATIANSEHPFIQWIVRVRDCCRNGQHELSMPIYMRLIRLLITPMRYYGHELPILQNFLKLWNKRLNLPGDLRAPALHRQDFQPLNFDHR